MTTAEKKRARRAEGSCYRCGHEARPGKTRCYPCAKKDAAWARKQWLRRRVAA